MNSGSRATSSSFETAVASSSAASSAPAILIFTDESAQATSGAIVAPRSMRRTTSPVSPISGLRSAMPDLRQISRKDLDTASVQSVTIEASSVPVSDPPK